MENASEKLQTPLMEYEQREEERWEVIVKYHGDLESLVRRFQAEAVYLLSRYAIITISRENLSLFLDNEEIEFAELPSRLYYELNSGVVTSCVENVWRRPYALSGEGVLMGIVDSGIDYMHPDFRNADGTTRILTLWDQTVPDGFYDSERINRAIRTADIGERNRLVPMNDSSGHGTAVAGIAAGNGRSSDGRYTGVAYQSQLFVVKLGNSERESFPRTTNLLEAVDFLVREAGARNQPMVINLSFGNNYGAHDGNSLLEQYLSEVSDYYKISIVVGTGNEGEGRSHAAGNLLAGRVLHPFLVSDGEQNVSLQIWKNAVDFVNLQLEAPNKEVRTWYETPISGREQVFSETMDGTRVYIHFGRPKPYSVSQDILVELFPEREEYVASGIWNITLVPESVRAGDYNIWLLTGEVQSGGTGFLYGEPDVTLTIPSTADKVISVGAYNDREGSLASFSGRGFTVGTRQSKPDLVAPGVGIMAPALFGGYAERTGTSMATPFVSGAAALLMEWGIVKNNDPYMYGQKVKAALRMGAIQLPGEITPSKKTGYGALCVERSITCALGKCVIR